MAFVLGQPPQGHHPFALSYHYQSQPVAMDSGNREAGDGGAAGGGGGGGWSEDDLLASLSSFGVEGEDERNLSTIKAMLASGWGGGNAAAGGIGTAFNSQGFHSHNPPPNTPTLSKSMELYSSSLNGSGGTRAYFDGSNRGESARRRDVSLERGPAGRDRSHSRATQEMDTSMEEDEEGELGHEEMPVEHGQNHGNGRLNAFGMPAHGDTGGGSGVLQNTQTGWSQNGSNGHGAASYASAQQQQQQQSPFISNGAFAPPAAPNPFQANSLPGRPTPPNTRSRTRQQQQQQQQQYQH